MPIKNYITAIVLLMVLSSVATLARGEETSLPTTTAQQQEPQPSGGQPSEASKPSTTAPLVESIQSSPSDTSLNPDFIGPKMGFIDELHGEISERLLTTAVWLDSYFEDERVEKEINRSYIRFRYDMFYENRAATTYRPTVSMRLALPQLEKKFHLVVSAEQPEPVSSSTTVPAGTTGDRIGVTEDRNVTTAVHYILQATEEQNFVVRSGAQFSHGTIVLFAAPRYRYFVPFSVWGFRFTQEAVWKTDTKWQLDTLFDLERQLPRGFFFRSSLGGTWMDGTNGYFYSLSFSLRQALDPKHALDYGWINSYQTRPVYELSEILLIVRYRQNLWRDWFFFEVAPQLRFPRSGNFDGIPGVLFRFEMFFGNKA
jgi:hypothetical protein